MDPKEAIQELRSEERKCRTSFAINVGTTEKHYDATSSRKKKIKYC